MYAHMVTLHCRGHDHDVLWKQRKSTEQRSADNMKYDRYTDRAEGQYGGYFTEVTLTWEPPARKQNCTYYVFHTSE